MRNFFTALGIVSVFAIFFFIIRPDWIKQLASSPSPAGPPVLTKVKARLTAERIMMRDLQKERGGLLQFEPLVSGEDLTTKIIEDVGDDLPSRNTPYMLVINKSTNTMRYCQLSPQVRKIALSGVTPSEVKLQELINTPGGPYQVVIWVPSALDLQLEFEVMIPSPARS